MVEKDLLENMARVVSEIQVIDTWIEDAKANRIARIRYQKFKPILQRLVGAHKELAQAYEALEKERHHVPACDQR